MLFLRFMVGEASMLLNITTMVSTRLNDKIIAWTRVNVTFMNHLWTGFNVTVTTMVWTGFNVANMVGTRFSFTTMVWTGFNMLQQ